MKLFSFLDGDAKPDKTDTPKEDAKTRFELFVLILMDSESEAATVMEDIDNQFIFINYLFF